jgi:Zn-dependent M28 family amino/carboxypeptidase
MLPKNHKFFNNYDFSDMYGGSDYYSFLEIGIPSGGLDTGAGSLKTPEERHRFGGIANAAYDPCYHQSCDTVENVATDVLEALARSAAQVVEITGVMKNVREWIGK